MRFQGILGSIARTGAGTTGGITGNTTITLIGVLPTDRSIHPIMWDGVCFGISVNTLGTQPFSCYITATMGGVTIPIAGLSGIATTTSTLLPLINERAIGTPCGTTQSSFNYGFPTPMSIVFANSATPGQSYSAIVYGTLYQTK